MGTFSNITGNDQAIKTLKPAITQKKISHSYIFSGPYGTGKKLISRELAKYIQCQNGGISDNCDCSSCVKAKNGVNPDIINISLGDSKSVGVDAIREKLIRDIYIKPYYFNYKIYILENCETITIPAQNAMLKIIEEPPKYAVIILLSENYNLFLPTITSRCSNIKINPLNENELTEYIKEYYNLPDNTCSEISEISFGSIGRAKDIIEFEGYLQLRKDIINYLKAIGSKDIADNLIRSQEIEKYKENIDIFIKTALLWYRDLFVFSSTKSDKYVFQKSLIKEIDSECRNINGKNIFKKINALTIFQEQLRVSASFDLAVDSMVLRAT